MKRIQLYMKSQYYIMQLDKIKELEREIQELSRQINISIQRKRLKVQDVVTLKTELVSDFSYLVCLSD